MVMQIISNISDTIEMLLDEAEEHIEYAHQIKESYPSAAAAYYKLSADEMLNVTAMHDQVTALIELYRKEHGDPPERMMGRYEYIHEKHIKKANKIKILQGLFK